MAKRYIRGRTVTGVRPAAEPSTVPAPNTARRDKVMHGRVTRGLVTVALVSVFVALFVHSCAYYNTLYNARRIYGEAEVQREESGSGRQLRDKYGEVVKKCANLISGYPDSRWIDDALFLMGKALVRQGEYNKGIRKFIELRTNFPESKYAAPSLYWLALANFEKRDYLQALEFAERFLERNPDHELRYRVMFLAGDIQLELENTEEALNFYSMVADRASKREVVDEAVLKSAELFYKKEQWEKAAASYERALRKGLTWALRYEISLSLGECYTKIGRCAEAMEIFDGLIEEILTSKEKPPLVLGRATSYECMDSLDAALTAYEEVTKDFPKSSFSAEAYYHMGIIYHEKMDSLARAQEVFSKVAGEFANSEFAAVSLQKSNSMKRLVELQQSEGKGETKEQAADKRFLTAEIQLMRLSEVDLAIGNYRAVIDSFADTEVAPKAGYALAWIYHHKIADSVQAVDMYRDVAMRYPRSPQAKGAVMELGNLGADELKGELAAYIDSALADTAATRAEELERRRRMRADSTAVDSMAAERSDSTGALRPDSIAASKPRILQGMVGDAERSARRDSLLIPLGEGARDTIAVPDSTAASDTSLVPALPPERRSPPGIPAPADTAVSPSGPAPADSTTSPGGAVPPDSSTAPDRNRESQPSSEDPKEHDRS